MAAEGWEVAEGWEAAAKEGEEMGVDGVVVDLVEEGLGAVGGGGGGGGGICLSCTPHISMASVCITTHFFKRPQGCVMHVIAQIWRQASEPFDRS